MQVSIKLDDIQEEIGSDLLKEMTFSLVGWFFFCFLCVCVWGGGRRGGGVKLDVF